jgi:hypothetical protein
MKCFVASGAGGLTKRIQTNSAQSVVCPLAWRVFSFLSADFADYTDSKKATATMELEMPLLMI